MLLTQLEGNGRHMSPWEVDRHQMAQLEGRRAQMPKTDDKQLTDLLQALMSYSTLRIQGTKEVTYDNNYDGVLNKTCPSGNGFFRVQSIHNNYYEDRRWSWECRPFGETPIEKPNCLTSEYVNSYDGPMNFQCEENEYLAGVYSVHKNYYEDRIWKFTCCASPSIQLSDCALSDYVNQFDKELYYESRPNQVMRGAWSDYQSNYYE